MKKKQREEDYTSYDTYDRSYDDSGRDDSYDDGYDDYYDEPYDEGYDEEYPEDYDDGDDYYEEDDYGEESYDDNTRYSRGSSYDDSYDDDQSYRKSAPRRVYSSDYEDDDEYEDEDEIITPHKEHFFTGLLGALVLALVGAALYFVVYQFGYVAGICGLVTYLISYLGYCICSRTRFSGKGIVVSLLFTIIVMFAAELLCISSTIYQDLVETYNISFLEAVKRTPDYLKNQDVLKASIKELGMCYICSLIVLIPTIINAVTCRKKK